MTYTIAQATAKAATYGFTRVYLRDGETRKVGVFQRWTAEGAEFLDLRIAHGKWKGSSVGSIHRPSENPEPEN